MAVRIDLEFSHPLGRDSRMDLRLAVADLAKAERIYFGRSGFSAVIMGEAMSRDRVIAKLNEFGLHPDKVISSLSEDEDAIADEEANAHKQGKERYKAIGRGG